MVAGKFAAVDALTSSSMPFPSYEGALALVAVDTVDVDAAIAALVVESGRCGNFVE